MPGPRKSSDSDADGGPRAATPSGGSGGGSRSPLDNIGGYAQTLHLLVKSRGVNLANFGITFSSTVIAQVFSYPLDSIKTRMQTYRKYNGVRDCILQTYRSEGIKGFYRGSLVPTITISLFRGVSFEAYNRIYKAYAPYFGPAAFAITDKSKHPTLSRALCSGASGATTGAFLSLFTTPLEYAKVCAQTSSLVADSKDIAHHGPHNVAARYKNKGAFRLLWVISQQRGLPSLYTGFGLHLVRDTIGTGTFFMTYEGTKHYMVSTMAGLGVEKPSVWTTVVPAGILCGVFSWAFIYPIDAAKSVYQSRSLAYPKGTRLPPAPRIEYFNKKVYSGAGVNVVRSVASSVAFWMLYDYSTRTLGIETKA